MTEQSSHTASASLIKRVIGVDRTVLPFLVVGGAALVLSVVSYLTATFYWPLSAFKYLWTIEDYLHSLPLQYAALLALLSMGSGGVLPYVLGYGYALLAMSSNSLLLACALLALYLATPVALIRVCRNRNPDILAFRQSTQPKVAFSVSLALLLVTAVWQPSMNVRTYGGPYDTNFWAACTSLCIGAWLSAQLWNGGMRRTAVATGLTWCIQAWCLPGNTVATHHAIGFLNASIIRQ